MTENDTIDNLFPRQHRYQKTADKKIHLIDKNSSQDWFQANLADLGNLSYLKTDDF